MVHHIHASEQQENITFNKAALYFFLKMALFLPSIAIFS